MVLVLASVSGLLWVFQGQGIYGDTAPAPTRPAGQTTASSHSDLIWDMLARVNRARALSDLRRLTGEEPICAGSECYSIANRLTGSEGLHRAMDYIAEELVGLGYEVEFRDWSFSGRSDRNLIARKWGGVRASEEIYLVAHVDGIKTGDAARYPSADDNASGAVGNLEAARALSSYSFSRTVVLLFTTGEEQGSLGARGYVDQLAAEALSSIKYVVNVDMSGYDANGDRAMQLWSGNHAPSLALTQVMSETITAFQVGLAPEFVVGCD
jgi:acetylornithine deacetylase/succinyl-diaminopimelate desuccinylase-like protein